mmetsp:Transcript_15246/g.29280  ORF Transcript_15246/g.29280 Transcript_15246/m.29280 type:complete len:269 (-) Transcript_15246:176-982(-)
MQAFRGGARRPAHAFRLQDPGHGLLEPCNLAPNLLLRLVRKGGSEEGVRAECCHLDSDVGSPRLVHMSVQRGSTQGLAHLLIVGAYLLSELGEDACAFLVRQRLLVHALLGLGQHQPHQHVATLLAQVHGAVRGYLERHRVPQVRARAGSHLERVAGHLHPLGLGSVRSQRLLTLHRCKVEQHRRLLKVDVGLRRLLPRLERVEPRKLQRNVVALLADGEPALYGSQSAEVFCERILACLQGGGLFHHSLAQVVHQLQILSRVLRLTI